jgi:hypothetical protein
VGLTHPNPNPNLNPNPTPMSQLRFTLDTEAPHVGLTHPNLNPNPTPEPQLRFTLDTEAPHVGLLQGPPGTGKTHTAVEVVAFLLRDMVNTKDEEYATNPHREHDKIKDQILVTAYAPSRPAVMRESERSQFPWLLGRSHPLFKFLNSAQSAAQLAASISPVALIGPN